MSFPEWGHSYNALYVPLRQWGWHCALMPAGEVKEEGSFNGPLSFEERENKRRERKKQIEQDKEDFHRLFRVGVDPHNAASSFEFGHYVNFIRDTLRVSSWDVRDGDGITRVLRNAVRDGRIIPVINRAWHGGQRVFKHYAPLHWPHDGSGVSFATSVAAAKASTGRFKGPFAAAMHAADTVMNRRLASGSRSISSEASRSGAFEGLGAGESVAEALLGAEGSTDDSGCDSMLKSFGDSDDGASLRGDAQPFEYVPANAGDDMQTAWLPSTDGPPNSWMENPSGKKQWRYYDENGDAAVDIDFGHDHGFGAPHSHNWENGRRDNGNPVSIF